MEAKPELTFAQLDREAGFPDPPAEVTDEFPAPAWYRRVRDVPLVELPLEDICRACRQRVHLTHSVERALEFLVASPMAGEMYDGELLCSLATVPWEYWAQRTDQRSRLAAIIRRESFPEVSADVRVALDELSSRIGP